MSRWGVWWKGPNGVLMLKGFNDFGTAVQYASGLGDAFVALVAPNTAGLVHVWKPLEDNAYAN